MELMNPEKYKGYSDHPAVDNKLRQVKRATITPDAMTSGVELNIYFEDGERFYTYSSSVIGAKQCFAFQCKAGSKWVG